MIPRGIFEHIIFASSHNHGARLVKENKVFSLKKEGGVKATLFIYQGSELTWEEIPLNQVPDSTKEDWETWDEY